MNWQETAIELLPFVPAFLLSISVHESAHALTAKLLGDDTAAKRGRISLYPPRHMDLFGTVVLPLISMWMLGIVYGYAKPTPVDPGKLRNPKRDFSLVALAGPASNFALALISAGLGRLFLPSQGPSGPLTLFFGASLSLNLVLGVVNALPLPGFDGMKALYILLPDEWCWRLNRAERFGILYLALLSLLGVTGQLWNLVRLMLQLMAQLTGFPG